MVEEIQFVEFLILRLPTDESFLKGCSDEIMELISASCSEKMVAIK